MQIMKKTHEARARKIIGLHKAGKVHQAVDELWDEVLDLAICEERARYQSAQAGGWMHPSTRAALRAAEAAVEAAAARLAQGGTAWAAYEAALAAVEAAARGALAPVEARSMARTAARAAFRAL